MIKALILYYLSLKPTHGYEIQKFIQLNHMDTWTKIQSGSIYYALGKLEKEGLISLHREENIGAKIRKIYGITEEGKEALTLYIQEEVMKEIYEIGSDKFILYPILDGMSEVDLKTSIHQHIQKLRVKARETEHWQKVKVGVHTLKVESICFEMMLSSLSYQIKWHEALLEELEACRVYSRQMGNLIRTIDFSSIDNLSEVLGDYQEDEVEQLRKEILDNPDGAEEKLDQLIKLIKRD